MERRPLQLPTVLLALALLTAFAMTLVLTWEMTFFQDTWAFLINRREITADTLFMPHNEHLVAVPVLIEWVLMQVFGLSSAKPEYVLLAIFLVVTALLFYVYVKRRVGEWLALFATILILCLGPAWEVLLWPFEITFIGPLLFGIAMLLALERGDRRGDALGCLFLCLAIGFSGLGISFIAGAVVLVLRGPRQTWLRRSYIVVIPLLLYAAWWLGWGHEAASHITAYNVLASPRFVADSLAFSVGSIAGLGPPIGSVPEPNWGRALLVGLALLLGYLYWRFRPRLHPGLWPIAAIAFANWFLTAFNDFPGRDPSSSRYQYAGAIFILMILANLFAGARPGRKGLVAAAALTLLAIGPNLVMLKDGRQILNPQSNLTRADTAALEIAEQTVPPEFQLTEDVAGTPSLINVYAEPYFEAVDEFGSPAYSVEELIASPIGGRRQADVILSRALPISVSTTPGAFDPGGGAGCEVIPGGAEEVPEVALAPGTTTRVEVSPGPSAALDLRRFATGEYPVGTEGSPGGSVTELEIPADEASGVPWLLRVEAEQRTRVCPG